MQNILIASFCLVTIVAVVFILVMRKYVRREGFEMFADDLKPESFGLAGLGLTNVSSSWRNDPVPKIIHQTAPSEKWKWHSIWEHCQKTWLERFPGFEYKMWTDEDIEDLIKNRFKRFYPIYKAYPKNIYRIDAFRYFVLYEYGGIYADMDYECVQNFYSLLPNGKVSIAESAIAGEDYQNALMASPRHHPFWMYVISDVIDHRHLIGPVEATGPEVIIRVAKKVPYGMLNPLPESQFSVETVPLPSEYHTPNTFQPSSRTDVYAIHHGTCSYCSDILS